MRIIVRPQRVVVVSQLEDDTTRKRLREVNDLMKGAPPGATLADVIAARCMREREARGRANFEHLWKHGTHDPEQGGLFERAKKEDIQKLEAALYMVIPERPQEAIRWNLWEIVVKAYPELSNDERQQLLNDAVEGLILGERIVETSDMKYFRRPPRFKQLDMESFFS